MKNLLFVLGLLSVCSLSAQAFVDSQYAVTEQYMLNSGYSAEAAKYAELSTRDPYAPTDDIYPKHSPKRFLIQLWKKIDPVAFPEYNTRWHQIKYTPSFYDYN